MKVFVTGGAGFIGSAVCRLLVGELGGLGSERRQAHLCGKSRVAARDRSEPALYISPSRHLRSRDDFLLREFDPDAVLHLAAESHVDRSIDGPSQFIKTNVEGTYTLLEATLVHWRRLPAERAAQFRFHHVSTDEVFGSLGPAGKFTETTHYEPNSPYSASKAASDHLVRAWQVTYGLPTVLSNYSKNYGPYHFPEKLIPLAILKALHGEPIPVYGKGDNVRDWLYVEDHARALYTILTTARAGESYNVGGNAGHSNLEVVVSICR